MYELMLLGVWGLVAMGALVVVNVSERRQWAEERRDLLNRIMARDYREFAEATKQQTATAAPIKVVSVDELRRDLQEDEREPLGMPV